ncbi:MAG: hypothetical protein K8M05_05690 [Deltaproteobacteria bacterium]|nr:hypothetical protein [Kofleriaceae bacterium]
MRGTTSLSVLFASALLSCGGGKAKPSAPAPAPGPEVGVADGVTAAEPGQHHTLPAKIDPIAPRPDREPELFLPPLSGVGVGQTVSFATTAIDQDLDDIAVTVTSMPASARFDALTQTVTWKPTKEDLKAKQGVFQLEVKDLTHGGAAKVVEWTFPVGARKAPPAVAPRASDAAEVIFTIREPKRVEATAKAYPFDTMLALGAGMMRPSMPPEAVARLGKPDKKALFRSFLKGMAEIHQNSRLDPDAKEFDKASFGNPRDWQLVVVRPRIDKKFHELRLVYQAVKAPEPVFAMFRVRPVQDSPTLPPEAKAENNKVFSELFWKAFLDDTGAVNAKLAADPKAHGKAVAAFVKAVLTYKGSAPWAVPGFIALPTEARMGGGSARNPDGSYRSGDGWAWSVMKPMPTADGAAQAYVNIGIPGFWTHVVPSPDKKAWVGKCAPAFDPDDKRHKPGWEVLCRKALGFVDLPADEGGKVVPAKLDAVNLFKAHKLGASVDNLPLDDARRDHGEENGMTCAQCHIRNFGVRDYTDPATADPSAGMPKGRNRRLPTLNFQIVPSHTWEAYTLEFMQDQECKTKQHLETALGKAPALSCPLADPAAPRVTVPLPSPIAAYP